MKILCHPEKTLEPTCANRETLDCKGLKRGGDGVISRN